MPRDAGPTRDSLIEAGLRLFADRGIHAPLSAVVVAAGQRNTSALHYHFGGREGLLAAITSVHNERIETARAAMLDDLAADGEATLDDLVRAMIVPWAQLLDDIDGRRYLSVVSQFDHLFELWDEADRSPPEAARNMWWIVEVLPDGFPDAVKRERITQLLSMVAEALGMRARGIDRGRPMRLGHDEFVANLVEMMVGALRARPPATASAPARGRRTPPGRAGSR
jgi:AcrR family transcriptional regulator